MDLWFVLAFILFVIAAVLSGLQRAYVMLLLCAGLAAWVLPAAWAALD